MLNIKSQRKLSKRLLSAFPSPPAGAGTFCSPCAAEKDMIMKRNIVQSLLPEMVFHVLTFHCLSFILSHALGSLDLSSLLPKRSIHAFSHDWAQPLKILSLNLPIKK
ncbi:hypothetical protein KIL84_014313 [Mauremys mutica]|uniref:Uncharacterized protein n=1 Tax=Mauremys mutica TaxID=74926 RepID=A0A9D3XPF8_9SAUR|nr:hypothetical protein KIL84_014313 [Mauremys mutica]